MRVGVPPSRQGTIHKGALVDVVGEMFGGGKHPLKSFPAGARSRFPGAIPWRNLLIPGPLIQGPDSLFDLRIADHQEPPTLFPPLGAHTPASRIFRKGAPRPAGPLRVAWSGLKQDDLIPDKGAVR